MANMRINNQEYTILDTLDNIVTIPDCFVLGGNKIGTGHGEAKLYLGSKTSMHRFMGEEGFSAKCFLLKTDLQTYLSLVKNEYTHPSHEYSKKHNFPSIWETHKATVDALEDVIFFNISDQTQIQGPRGYVNAARTDTGYKLIRKISLPIISYISIMKLRGEDGEIIFYWKIFVDFDIAADRKASSLALKYGKGPKLASTPKISSKILNIRNARVGQGKYRDDLLEECPFCPITMVNDERLLIASHIKPWAQSNNIEKIDPKNGFIFTPLYDKLFDRGFITFSDDKRMIVSNWLSPRNCERLQLENNKLFPRLPIDDERRNYLSYHRSYIFKG